MWKTMSSARKLAGLGLRLALSDKRP